MDVAALVSGVITGVVGLAGIAGTAWQGKRGREAASRDLQQNMEAANQNLLRGIDADNKRARIATKRQVYAAWLTAYNKADAAAYRAAQLSPIDMLIKPKPADLQIQREAIDAKADLFNAQSELWLIAPDHISGLAMQLTVRVGDMAARSQHERDPDQPRDGVRLISMMRNDLGERPFGVGSATVKPEATVNTPPSPESSRSATGLPD